AVVQLLRPRGGHQVRQVLDELAVLIRADLRLHQRGTRDGDESLRYVHLFEAHVVEPGSPRTLAEAYEENRDARAPVRRRLEVNGDLRPVRIIPMVDATGGHATAARTLDLKSPVGAGAAGIETARFYPTAEAIPLAGG